MRKLLVLLVSVVLSAGILAACQGVDENKLIRGGVSDMTEQVLAGASEDFEVEIVSGYREAPYALDGVAQPTERFFTIKATPLAACTAESVEYSFTAGGETFTGVLPRSRYRSAYTVDLKKQIPCGEEVKITIKDGDKSSEISAVSVITGDMLTAEKALEAAVEKYREKLTGMIENKDFKGEICVRLINDRGQAEKKYFWYVAVIKSKTEMNSVLIDAVSGEIVAERN